MLRRVGIDTISCVKTGNEFLAFVAVVGFVDTQANRGIAFG